MKPQVAIKIPSDAPIAKVVSIIRSIESLPISEITRRIKEADYLLTYDLGSTQGVNTIISCYDQFIKLGITPSLFEHDRPTSIYFLRNLSHTYQEIDDEIDAEIEAEMAEEDNE